MFGMDDEIAQNVLASLQKVFGEFLAENWPGLTEEHYVKVMDEFIKNFIDDYEMPPIEG